MKKKSYLPPLVEVIGVNIEKGFAITTIDGVSVGVDLELTSERNTESFIQSDQEGEWDF